MPDARADGLDDGPATHRQPSAAARGSSSRILQPIIGGSRVRYTVHMRMHVREILSLSTHAPCETSSMSLGRARHQSAPSPRSPATLPVQPGRAH